MAEAEVKIKVKADTADAVGKFKQATSAVSGFVTGLDKGLRAAGEFGKGIERGMRAVTGIADALAKGGLSAEAFAKGLERLPGVFGAVAQAANAAGDAILAFQTRAMDAAEKRLLLDVKVMSAEDERLRKYWIAEIQRQKDAAAAYEDTARAAARSRMTIRVGGETIEGENSTAAKRRRAPRGLGGGGYQVANVVDYEDRFQATGAPIINQVTSLFIDLSAGLQGAIEGVDRFASANDNAAAGVSGGAIGGALGRRGRDYARGRDRRTASLGGGAFQQTQDRYGNETNVAEVNEAGIGYGLMSDGILAGMEALVSGEGKVLAAVKKRVAGSMTSLGMEAVGRALFEIGLAWADPLEAPRHIIAAAKLGAAATVLLGGAAALNAGGGGGAVSGGVSGGAGGGFARSSREGGDGARNVTIHINAAAVGGKQQIAEWVAEGWSQAERAGAIGGRRRVSFGSGN